LLGEYNRAIVEELKRFQSQYPRKLIYIKNRNRYLEVVEEEIKSYDIGLILINNTLFKKRFKNLLL